MKYESTEGDEIQRQVPYWYLALPVPPHYSPASLFFVGSVVSPPPHLPSKQIMICRFSSVKHSPKYAFWRDAGSAACARDCEYNIIVMFR